MRALSEAVRASLQAAGLGAGSRLLCGVSGGCDSTALLHALCMLRNELSFELHVCHVQHGLRGAESLEDEQFVRKLCSVLSVPLHVRNAGLTGSMHDTGMETLARNSRRAIFLQLMEELSCDALLVAHHRDDQTETVLMHLLRGAGMEGLRGMKPIVPFGRGVLLRPFLAIPRAELEKACTVYREDRSNYEAVTPRNALRLNILPELEQLFPGAGAHIAAAAETLAADEDFLGRQAEQLFQQAVYRIPPLFMLSKAALMDAPDALVRRVIRRWWQEGLLNAGLFADERALSRQDTLALCALLRTEGSHNLPCGLTAVSGRLYLHLLAPSGVSYSPDAAPFSVSEKEYAFPHCSIRRTEAQGFLPRSTGEIILPPSLLSQELVFRPMRSGDRIHPFGAPGSKALRRYLTDRQIDLPLRPMLTVLACGDEILWIPSLCTSEALRLSSVPEGSVRLQGAHTFLPH